MPTWLIDVCLVRDMTPAGHDSSYIYNRAQQRATCLYNDKDSLICDSFVTWLMCGMTNPIFTTGRSTGLHAYIMTRLIDVWLVRDVTHVRHDSSYPPAPMNHVKYLRTGPAEMPFQNWYTANTNHFRLTDSVRWKSKRQLGWVINMVPHNLVRRIIFGQ